VPTYDYRCKSCGHELEVVQSFTDDALTTCEVCGGDLRKVFGSVGISFKGSGFYKNDSRTSGTKGTDSGTSDTKPAETKSPEATPATKSDTKSDSKPAATTTSSS
jgi:putative FmdB family regulatory protein